MAWSLLWVFAVGGSPDEASLRVATDFYQQGRWKQAAESFATIANQASGADQRAAAHFYLGESLMQLGDFSSASENYDVVLKQANQFRFYPRALFRAGEAAWLGGQAAKARSLLQRYVQDYPHGSLAAYAYTYLGQIAFSAQDYEASIRAFQTVVSSYAHSPKEIEARIGLAKSLLAARRSGEVALVLGTLATGDDRALAAEAMLLLARAQYDLGQYEIALQAFRKLYRENSDQSIMPRARLAAGWSLWKIGRFEEIRQELLPLADAKTWAVDYQYLLGMCAYGDRDWPTAIEHLTVAIDGRDNHPSRAAILFYLADSSLRAERLDEAQRWFQKLLASDSNSPWDDDALWGLARIARANKNLEQFENAVAELRKHHPTSQYLEQVPSEEGSGEEAFVLSAEETLLDEAVGLERDGRYDAALAAYRELLQQSTGRLRAEGLRRSAGLHHRLSHHDEARDLYEELISSQPHSKHSAEVMSALGWIEVQLGNQHKGTHWFRELVARFPQSAQTPEAAYWLAGFAADEKDSARALKLTDWMLIELEGSSDRSRQELWEQAVLLKCQLEAAAQRWQTIEELVAKLSGQFQFGTNKSRADFWLAEAKFRLGRYDESRIEFDQLLQSIASLDEPWTAMVSLRQAQLRLRRQQWSEVLKIVDRLEEKHPEFELQYEVDYLRGRALAGRGEMTSAREAYDRVLSNPNAKKTETAAMAQWMIGETYFHQRDYTRARQAYMRLVEGQSQPEWQARAALQAGKCWELEEGWDQATTLYATALERWQGTQSAHQLKARLKWANSQTTKRR